MTRSEFRDLVSKKIVLLDGATGSNMQKSGMPVGVCPEKWILDNPRPFIDLQKGYIEAGTDILYAPTFTCSRVKLEEYGLEKNMKSMNTGLVKLSKQAVLESGTKRKVYIAGDITLTGQQLYPLGPMTFDELVEIYKEQITYIQEEGVDLFVIETMMSLQESRAALLAVKETTDLPVMITLTFNENNKTLYGTDPITAVTVLQNMGADAIGVNCSTGPDKMAEIVSAMKEYAFVPIIAKPNAGLPELIDGETVFNMGPSEFANQTAALVDAGASILGGCCGTTIEHMRALNQCMKKVAPPLINQKKKRVLTTERKTLKIDTNGHFLVIGERINPTGKKALQEELREGNLDTVLDMAREQSEHGANILDINMGMNGVDERELMEAAITEVLTVTDLPISIDSSHVHVIERALRIYPGRALINSISLEKEKMKKLLPLAKKYGAMFILLPVSDRGVPIDLKEKKEIILAILKKAKEIGLSEEDIIVDGLVNTIGANTEAAIQTMETIRFCKDELGLATVVGLSNISFGLPERQYVNSTFLAFAIQAGLTMAIANPSQELLMNTAYAADLLMGKEEGDIRYIQRVTTLPKKDKVTESKCREIKTEGNNSIDTKSTPKTEQSGQQGDKGNNSNVNPSLIEEGNRVIYEGVIKGNRKHIVALVIKALEAGKNPGFLLNELLIPAINEVGKLFDRQIYFLPQLIASAETMKLAIDYLEPLLKKDGDEKKLATVVIATVAGDVHDIGKNLVVLMLKNYGFRVIDLGKDVPSEKIIATAMEEEAEVIALSALMTTTMLEMKQVIRLRNERGLSSKVIIGGAVITQSYADEIGADGFAKDAGETVTLIKKLLGLNV